MSYKYVVVFLSFCSFSLRADGVDYEFNTGFQAGISGGKNPCSLMGLACEDGYVHGHEERRRVIAGIKRKGLD